MDRANQRLVMHIAEQVAVRVMDLPPSERLRAIKQEVGALRSLYQQALSDPEARVHGERFADEVEVRAAALVLSIERRGGTVGRA